MKATAEVRVSEVDGLRWRRMQPLAAAVPSEGGSSRAMAAEGRAGGPRAGQPVVSAV